jgi:hypothetical protein
MVVVLLHAVLHIHTISRLYIPLLLLDMLNMIGSSVLSVPGVCVMI